MSRWVTLLLVLTAPVYGASLLNGALRTVDALRAEAERPRFAMGTRITLESPPLEEGQERRVRELRVGAGRVRQSCDGARCELFAGAGEGFRLLASYPRGQSIELWDHEGEIEMARVGHLPRWTSPPSPSTWWFAAGMSGLLLLALLGARMMGLASWLADLRHARPVRVRADGTLFFLDGRERGPARPSTPLPEGDGCALFSLDAPRGEAYREGAEERWVVIAGLPDAHRSAALRWRGVCEASLAIGIGAAILTCAWVTWIA
ncbi:MAG: hypothetical protein EVA89_35950 [Sandaracinaceae bacterium]|nr:MAG: hypothetical protein EVA89_35950 [Sandaracinaceae bacterium]